MGCSGPACWKPTSFSGWSTCDSSPRTSFFACASFHGDSPWRTKKTWSRVRGGARVRVRVRVRGRGRGRGRVRLAVA